MRRDFKIFKIKVPVILSDTQCPPLRRDARYITSLPFLTQLLFTPKFSRPLCFSYLFFLSSCFLLYCTVGYVTSIILMNQLISRYLIRFKLPSWATS